MTFPESIPSSENDPHTLDNILRSILDDEATEDSEANEQMQETKITEDALISRLVDYDFPFISQILTIRDELGEDSGLTILYEHLIEKRSKLDSKLATDADPSDQLKNDCQLTYLQGKLISAIQLLAAGKMCHDAELQEARTAEDGGNLDAAKMWKEMAYETRKEAEAQVLTNESLGPKFAARLLHAVSPEFEGDSLLPLDKESESYLMMYRLKQEKSNDDLIDVKAYALMGREVLETKVTPGQIQHPEFDYFALSLSWAVSRSILGPKHTLGLSAEQIDTYKSLIRVRMTEALKIAPELGIEPTDVLEMYESIVAELT